MATKAEQFGCTSEREGSCEHWTPPERAGIGGAPTDPKGSGRCELEKRMVRRMSSCPKTGKAYDRRTKVEKFGCLIEGAKCMEYESHPASEKLGGFCRVSGKGTGKAVNALHFCPREEALQRLGCEDGETRCRHYLTNVKVRGQIRSCSKVGKNIYELEECPEKAMKEVGASGEKSEPLKIEKKLEQLGCKDCGGYYSGICEKTEKQIFEMTECPEDSEDIPYNPESTLRMMLAQQHEAVGKRFAKLIKDSKKDASEIAMGSPARWRFRARGTDVIVTAMGKEDKERHFRIEETSHEVREVTEKEVNGNGDMDGRRRDGDILDAGSGATPDLREVPEVGLGVQRKNGALQEEGQDAEQVDTGIADVQAAGGGGVRVLALDVSTKCTGWALREGDRVTEHGSVKASGDDSERRKEIMRQGILPFLQQPLHYVVLERSFIAGSGDTSRLICETQGILKNLVHRLGHRLLEPNPTTWRSIFPGSGRCDKEAAIDAARLKDHVFESHDEAEAICLAYSFGQKLIKICEEGKVKKNGKKKDVPSNGSNRAKRSKRGGAPVGATQAA